MHASDRLASVAIDSADVHFEHGSEVAIARQLLLDLSMLGSKVVSSEGHLYQYDHESGAWQALPHDGVVGVIQSYDGAAVGKKGTLLIGSRKAEGAYRCALMDFDHADPGFFSGAATGALLGNGFACVSDGVVTLQPFDKSHRARHPLPFDMVEDVDIAPWSAFVADLFEGDSDGEDKAFALQEFVGACLVGIAPQYARCLVCVGGGANGKSTLLELLGELFPSSCVTSIPPQSWSREYYAARLRDAQVNICNELPEGDILSGETFKAIVTGEATMARDPYHKPYTFRPRAGHLFACNRLPGTVDHSHGFWRRFLVLGFNRDYTDRREVETKEQVVSRMRQHLPAALLWGLHGAARLMRRGSYTIPASHAEALDAWQIETNSVAAWMSDSPIRKAGVADDHGEWVRAADAYRDYRSWTIDNGLRAVSSVRFWQRLSALGVIRHRRGDGVRYGIVSDPGKTV